MASDWEKVAENLVRHVPSRGLYLRSKAGGKIILKSLGTKAVKIGKIKRDELLVQIRVAAGKVSGKDAELTRESLFEPDSILFLFSCVLDFGVCKKL